MAEASPELLQAPSPPEPEDPARRVLLRAAGGWHALELAAVREISPIGRVTRVPNAPPEVRGITTWHGKVLVLYDLAQRRAAPANTPPADRFAVVLDVTIPNLDVALLAEEVAEIRTVPRSQIAPVTTGDGAGSRGERVKGLTELDGVQVGILDVAKFFTHLVGA